MSDGKRILQAYMLPCALLICIAGAAVAQRPQGGGGAGPLGIGAAGGAAGAAVAQQLQGADPIFWCDLSRSQVSHERDAALAQIEALKFHNASLDARVKELEAKAAAPKKDEQQ
jgi:hypothetical protein